MSALAAAPRSPAPRSAAIVNIGCKVNQSEMEVAASLLREAGVSIRDAARNAARGADLYLVNTCTVTAAADETSRTAVRRARRANPDATVIVTGCSVDVDAATYARIDPRARLVRNEDKDALLDELRSLGRTAGERSFWSASRARTRAFIKIQDGCSSHCTYCIIPRARGGERSLTSDAVLADVRRAVAAGHREIVLTGINIGTYDGGSHTASGITLADLVRRLLAETDVERIRLSSIEPQHVDDDLLEAWADGAPRTLPHLHLPLQSGDDGVLRRMGRRYLAADYSRVVERARAAIPGVAIHADVMAGFPTEDGAAFARSLAFIRDLAPAGLHVFRYSARPGTPATRMTGQVDEPTRKARAGELLAVAVDARAAFARAGLGTTTRVLVESRLGDGRWIGHAEDHVVVAVSPAGQPAGQPDTLRNAMLTVRRTGIDPLAADRAVGEVLAVDHAPRPLRSTLAVLAATATEPALTGGVNAR